MIFLTATATDMSDGVTSLLSTFTSIFNSAWTLISGNWFLLASVGIPLIGGLIFAIVSMFRKSG